MNVLWNEPRVNRKFMLLIYHTYSNKRRKFFPDSSSKKMGGHLIIAHKVPRIGCMFFVISNTVNICLGWVVQLFHCVIFFVLSRTT
jgi:hypothetical protein